MAIEVATAADLDNVRSNPSGHYIQTADIDLSGYNWVPIENFTGTYDGQTYTIDNFYMNKASTELWLHYALFRYLSGATIRNVTMRAVNIQMPYVSGSGGGDKTGVIGGWAYSGTTFENCYTAGTIVSGRSGGICGEASGASFHKCATKVDYTGYARKIPPDIITTHNGNGIVSYGDAITIKNCYSRMTFAGGSYYEDPYDDFYPGSGITGTVTNTTIDACYTTGTNSIYDPLLSSGVAITNSYYDASLVPATGGTGTPRTTIQMTYPEEFATTYIDWDFDTIWRHDSSYTLNDGYPVFGGFNIWVKKFTAPEFFGMEMFGDWEVVPWLWVKKGFEWKVVTEVWTKQGGTWKTI